MNYYGNIDDGAMILKGRIGGVLIRFNACGACLPAEAGLILVNRCALTVCLMGRGTPV